MNHVCNAQNFKQFSDWIFIDFGNVFNASVPKSHSRNKKKRKNAQHPKKSKTKPSTKTTDNDIGMKETKSIKQSNKAKNDFLKFDSNQNDQFKLGQTKISSYKLKQSKSHRRNSLNHKKNALESNLISLGYDPKNMSLMKQRKLLNKAMKELSTKNNESDSKETEEKHYNYYQY